jgi:hypothetical protein
MADPQPQGSSGFPQIPHDRFTCASLDALPQGAAVRRILAAALEAVEPGAAVRRSLQRQDDFLSWASSAIRWLKSAACC